MNRIRDVLDDMFDYMAEAGIQMRQIQGRQYFPWVFNTDVLAERREEFIDLIAQEKFDDFLQINRKPDESPEGGLGVNGQDRDDLPPDDDPVARRRYVADLYWRQLMVHTQGYADVNLDNVSHDPRMNAMNERSLDFIRRLGNDADNKLLAEFLNKDLSGTMQTYVNQGVKRAEYVRRFGPGFFDEQGKRRTKLDEILAEAQATGATDAEIEMARKYDRQD